MNCANHPDRERVAFCQNCGKALCTECVRTVGASTYCEPCLAGLLAGAASGQAYASGSTPPAYAPGYTPGHASGYASGFGATARVPSQPNPGLAAVLGFIPGVGAMYNEQYAKGIVHLMVFAILVSLAHENGVFGLFIAGWIVYMAIEAHHTARARRDGAPLPNPFGLNDLSERLGFGKAWAGTAAPAAPIPPSAYAEPTTDAAAPAAAGAGYAPPTGAYAPVYQSVPASSFVPPASGFVPPASGFVPPGSNYVPPGSQWGAPQDAAYAYAPPVPPIPPIPSMPYVDPMAYRRRFPAGALWLIGLGVLFLFGNTGIVIVHARYVGPFVLIGIGVWIFVQRMTSTGLGFESDGTTAYSARLISAVRSSVWVFLSGILWLLDAFRILTWANSWPLFLIAGGIMLFLKRTVLAGNSYSAYPASAYPAGANAAPPAAPVATTALVPTHSQTDDLNTGASGDQEGR